MKKYLLLIACIFAMHFFTGYGMETMTATVEIITTDMIARLPASVIVVQESYINGGLIITYPIGTFTQPPTITLGVQAASHIDTLNYTVEISLNSATSATIMAYKNESGLIVEAATGEVTVHFVAMGT